MEEARQQRRARRARERLRDDLEYAVRRRKQVRDWHAANCNVGLGNFKDDPLRLKLAARYLERVSG